MPTSDSDPVDDTPLGRAARLLDAVSVSPLRFSEAQNLLGGLAPSSLNRLLKSMLSVGMLERVENGAYGPGPRLVRWHRSADTTLRLLARPVLEELLEELNATVVLMVRAGDEMVCLDRRTHESSPALMRPGLVRPIELPVIGSALMMDEGTLSDERELRRQLDVKGITTPMATIRRMLAKYRRNGWLDDLAAFYPPNRRFAFPIRKDGEVVAVLGLGCYQNRARDRDYRRRLIERMQHGARRLDLGLRQGIA
ncbi:MAG: hypothetical protein PF961_14975 [Planctomycetota bacterium]|jgi:DNA-binding IclR family transcriptional regulator|nr:hypothetical protein [Planctomycetota bacterium]